MMTETKIQLSQRKIRNGLRKQAEAHQREKEKVWDRLKEVKKPGLADMQVNVQKVQAQGRALRAGFTFKTEFDSSYSIEKSAINSVVRTIGKQHE